MTIRTKLALWYASLLTLIIIIFSVAVFAAMRVSMLSIIDAELQNIATRVRQNIRLIPSNESGALHTEIIYRSDEVFRVPGFAIQVWETGDGNSYTIPVLNRASADLNDYMSPLDPTTLDSSVEQFSNVSINDIAGRVTTRPFYSSGGQQIGVIQVATPIQTLEQATDTLLIIMISASVTAIIISAGLGMWFAGRILKPIDAIRHAASSIAETEDLSTRLKWEGPMDELGQLTRVFNRMIERLQALFQVQQRFVADVSHELRTPLTVIRGNLEIIERYGMDNGTALEAIRAETDRMSRMVNDLLLLTRVDYGDMEVDVYPFNLDELVLQIHEQTYILAKERDLKIVLGRIEPTRIKGNADRIRQMLTNLVNNAIKFTPDSGAIKLEIYPKNERAILIVEDTGIGISQENAEHIFDRFFQADHSRAHHSDSDGAGLGLSIVKWIVDAHHGSIKVESELNKGTRFEVSFPLLNDRQEPQSPNSQRSSRHSSNTIYN